MRLEVEGKTAVKIGSENVLRMLTCTPWQRKHSRDVVAFQRCIVQSKDARNRRRSGLPWAGPIPMFEVERSARFSPLSAAVGWCGGGARGEAESWKRPGTRSKSPKQRDRASHDKPRSRTRGLPATVCWPQPAGHGLLATVYGLGKVAAGRCISPNTTTRTNTRTNTRCPESDSRRSARATCPKRRGSAG